jgi:hypothetical protein
VDSRPNTPLREVENGGNKLVAGQPHKAGRSKTSARPIPRYIPCRDLDLKSAEEAEDYWSILPQRAIPEATPLGVLSAPTFLGARHAKSAA